MLTIDKFSNVSSFMSHRIVIISKCRDNKNFRTQTMTIQYIQFDTRCVFHNLAQQLALSSQAGQTKVD